MAKDPGDIVDDVTRKVRVLSDKCSTCIFRPGNRMSLREGYLQDIIRANVEAGALLTCHQTLPYGDFPDFGPAACRGFWDSHGQHTVAGIIARHVIGTTFVEPPGKESRDEKRLQRQWVRGERECAGGQPPSDGLPDPGGPGRQGHIDYLLGPGVSRFRQGGKPRRPVIVTSGKQRKTEARLANAYGVQKQAAVRAALERAEKIEQIVQSSNPHAIAAAAREAAGSRKHRDEAALQNFRKRIKDGEPLTEVQANLTESIGICTEIHQAIEKAAEDLLGDDQPAYPVTTEWAAEEGNWYSKESGWKCAIFRLKNGSREVLNCPHKHKTPETARGCALREAMGRNKHADWSDSVWKPDPRYPWTDGAVKALIDEIRAE